MKVLFFQMEEPVHSDFPEVDFPRLILSLVQHVFVVYFFSQLTFTHVKRDGAFLLVSWRRILWCSMLRSSAPDPFPAQKEWKWEKRDQKWEREGGSLGTGVFYLAFTHSSQCMQKNVVTTWAVFVTHTVHGSNLHKPLPSTLDLINTRR